MAPLSPHGRFAVHLPCGTVRGEHALFEQDCPCAPVVQRPGVFGRLVDLCAVCGHGLAWSGSRVSSLACASCRRVETALREALGTPVLPVWRLAVSNAFREVDGSRVPYRPLALHLWPVAADLPAHGRRVVRRLAHGLDAEELPLQLWELLHPESRDASVRAYEDLLGVPLSARVLAGLDPAPARP